MKKKITTAVIAFATLVLVNNQAQAASTSVGLEDDMGEGIILTVQQNSKTYSYDSSIISPEKFMAESTLVVGIEKKQDSKRYAADCSNLSAEHLMSEEICLENFKDTVATN